MRFSEDIDTEKLAEVALAILGLTAHQQHAETRVWKGLDWGLMGELHEQGWISDPRNKNKSVILTDEGKALAEQFLRKHFTAR